MPVIAEVTTVYRGGRRRWLSKKAAVRAEAIAIIKRKHQTERARHENGMCTEPGWHWTELTRSDVLLRRMSRLVEEASFPKEPPHA